MYDIDKIIDEADITNHGNFMVITFRYTHYEIRDVTIYGEWVFKPVPRVQQFMGVTIDELKEQVTRYLNDIAFNHNRPRRLGVSGQHTPKRNTTIIVKAIK